MGRPDPRTSSRLAGMLLAALVLSGCRAAVEPSALDVTAGSTPLPTAEPVGTRVPSVVGLTLDVAQSRLREAGFSGLPEDLLQERSQISEHSWQVCTQDPPVSGTLVELGVVRTEETCPGTTTTTSAVPTSRVADPTTATAVAKPKPSPQPSRTSAKPSPKSSPPSSKSSSKSSKAPERSSGSSVGTVHPGAFCDPPGSGVSKTGKPMVCGPAKDGRNRWQSA